MSGPAANESGAAGRRRALLLLGALLLASGLLRLWYLPSSDRLSIEVPPMRNVQAAFAGSAARDPRAAPAAWVPQLVVLRLAERLGDAAGGRPLLTPKHQMTRRGLETARLVSVLYGLAAAALLYLLARRLHSTSVALVAALILSTAPWHIQASVTFAPDVLVLALSILALWLALRAFDRPSAARLALVGLALGAAAAVKPTGLAVAPPVLLGLLLCGRGSRRGLRTLAVALPVALFTWWLLTPPSAEYAAFLEAERVGQAQRAAREASSRFTVAVFGLLFPLFESAHGRLLGSLALLGWVGQAFRCLFLLDPGPARPQRLMVLSAAPVFVLGWAWATPLFRESGFVPLLAYSALYAAVALEAVWETLKELLPGLAARRAAAAAAGALILLLAVPPAWSYVYSSAVKSTLSEALAWLRQGLPRDGPRLVLVEQAAFEDAEESAMRLARGLGLVVVPRLAAVDGERLAGADGEIFLARELAGADAEIYRGRRRAEARRRRVAPRLLRRSGPALVAILRPAPTAAEELELPVVTDGALRSTRVPGSPAGVVGLSIVARLPAARDRSPAPPRVWLDDEELQLAPGGFFPGQSVFVSERLPPSAEPRSLRLEPPIWMSSRRGEITLAAYLWRSASAARDS